MAIEIKQYIESHSKSSLEATIAGSHHKAYLVANLAFNDSPEASAEHYGLTLAEVYGAMAFYAENRATIENELKTLRAQADELGAQNLAEKLSELKK